MSFSAISLLPSTFASRNIFLLVLEAAGKKIMAFQSFFGSSLSNTQQFLTKKACLPCVTIHSFVFISTVFFFFSFSVEWRVHSVKIKLIIPAVVHTPQPASCENYFQPSLGALVILLIQRSLISYLAMPFFSTQSTLFKKSVISLLSIVSFYRFHCRSMQCVTYLLIILKDLSSLPCKG